MASHTVQEDNGVNENTVHSVRSTLYDNNEPPHTRSSLYEGSIYRYATVWYKVKLTKNLSENIVGIDPSEKPNDIDSVRSKTLPGDDPHEDKIPDGGYGWAIVVGAFAVQITSYGVTTAWYL